MILEEEFFLLCELWVWVGVWCGSKGSGVDVTSVTSSSHEFGVVGVTIDLYEGGNLLSFSFIGDHEHVLDTSVILVALPSRSWVYAWLRACWGRCLSVGFRLSGHQSSSCHELGDVFDRRSGRVGAVVWQWW